MACQSALAIDDVALYYSSSIFPKQKRRALPSFCRVVPLPEGAITDSAKAQFNNGVLEIVVQAPPREVSRGRRLEISESGDAPVMRNTIAEESVTSRLLAQ